MKIRTRAWMIVILVGWTYPAWWVVVKITDWVSDSVDVVEEKLRDRDARRRVELHKNQLDAAGLDP